MIGLQIRHRQGGGPPPAPTSQALQSRVAPEERVAPTSVFRSAQNMAPSALICTIVSGDPRARRLVLHPARRRKQPGQRNVGQLHGPVMLLSKAQGLHTTCLDAQRAMRDGGPTQTTMPWTRPDKQAHGSTGSTSERERDTRVGPHGTQEGRSSPAQPSPSSTQATKDGRQNPPLLQALVIRWPCSSGLWTPWEPAILDAWREPPGQLTRGCGRLYTV